MQKEKVEKILNLDDRDAGNRQKVYNALSAMVRNLNKYKGREIPIDDIQAVVSRIVLKYQIQPQTVFMTCRKDDKSGKYIVVYSVGIIRGAEHDRAGNVYATRPEMMLAKLALSMLYQVRYEGVPKRSETQRKILGGGA